MFILNVFPSVRRCTESKEEEVRRRRRMAGEDGHLQLIPALSKREVNGP